MFEPFFFQNEYVCWNDETKNLSSFTSINAWNAHNAILKVTLSKAFFRIQCPEPESILVTACADLHKVSKEHSAFPAVWLRSLCVASKGQGQCPAGPPHDSGGECS